MKRWNGNKPDLGYEVDRIVQVCPYCHDTETWVLWRLSRHKTFQDDGRSAGSGAKSDYINLKLFVLGRACNKGNYWFGTPVLGGLGKVTATPDARLLKNNRRDLYDAVRAILDTQANRKAIL